MTENKLFSRENCEVEIEISQCVPSVECIGGEGQSAALQRRPPFIKRTILYFGAAHTTLLSIDSLGRDVGWETVEPAHLGHPYSGHE